VGPGPVYLEYSHISISLLVWYCYWAANPHAMEDITIPPSPSSEAIVEVSYINTGWLPNTMRRNIIATQSDEVFDMPVLCFVVKKAGKVYIWVRVQR
jgi:hypothetical protein